MGRLLLHMDVVHPFEGGLSGVHFDDDLVAQGDCFGNDAAGGGQRQAAVFGDGGDFDDADVVTAVLSIETVADVLGEVTEMLVAHPDASGVDSRGDVLAGLVRPAAVDHVQCCPAVFGLSTDGGADEEVELHLALQVVCLDMISQGDGNHFGIAGRGETRPEQVLPGREELDGVFSLTYLAQQGLATDAAFQCSEFRHLLPPVLLWCLQPRSYDLCFHCLNDL